MTFYLRALPQQSEPDGISQRQDRLQLAGIQPRPHFFHCILCPMLKAEHSNILTRRSAGKFQLILAHQAGSRQCCSRPASAHDVRLSQQPAAALPLHHDLRAWARSERAGASIPHSSSSSSWAEIVTPNYPIPLRLGG